MLFGYIWVEHRDDVALLAQQRQALQDAGVTASDFYEDIDCVRHGSRPAREACLERLSTEDTLVVWQLERFADSRAHLLDVLKDFWNRQIGLKVLNGKGAIFDSAQVGLNFAIQVIEATSELEIHINREAILEGVAAARSRGQVLGPKPKMTPAMLRQAIEELTTSDQSFTAISEKHGITRATLYNYLNGDGSLKPLGLKLLSQDELLQ